MTGEHKCQHETDGRTGLTDNRDARKTHIKDDKEAIIAV